MTVYVFSKNGKELKKIKCSEEFAASIAMQTNCEYEIYNPTKVQDIIKEKDSREQKLVTKITKEINKDK